MSMRCARATAQNRNPRSFSLSVRGFVFVCCSLSWILTISLLGVTALSEPKAQSNCDFHMRWPIFGFRGFDFLIRQKLRFNLFALCRLKNFIRSDHLSQSFYGRLKWFMDFLSQTARFLHFNWMQILQKFLFCTKNTSGKRDSSKRKT